MKNYSIKKKIIVVVASFFGLILFAGASYAAYTYATGVRADSTATMDEKTELVDKSDTGWNIRNTTGLDYFVPNNTQGEFNAFKTFAGAMSNLDVCEHHFTSRCGLIPSGDSYEDGVHTAAVWFYDDCNFREDFVDYCCLTTGNINTDCVGTGDGSMCRECASASCVESSGTCGSGAASCPGGIGAGCTFINLACVSQGGFLTLQVIIGGLAPGCMGWTYQCNCP